MSSRQTRRTCWRAKRPGQRKRRSQTWWLLPGERPAYDALVAATHVRAEETGQGKFYWNVAPMRSMCEMVRRVPTTKDELMLCRGLGGAGVKVAKHGDCLLEALRPFVEELRELHEARVVD